jgi:ABC-2 type transport system permease protein
MNKILLVARREFLSRVQKKTFLLTTIGVPLLIFIFYALIIYFSMKGNDSLNIAVVDNANLFQQNQLQSDDEINFKVLKNQTTETLNAQLENKKIDGYIVIPQGYNVMSIDTLQVKSAQSISLTSRNKIQKAVTDVLDEKRLSAFNLSKSKIDSLKNMSTIKFSTSKNENDSDVKAGISYGVGFTSGFLIYMILFIYGSMVMRGVMEEKVSRIAEVIVSSVKPFQLMMGKITGIGAVGLIQFIIWIILVIGLQFLLPFIFPEVFHHMQSTPVQPAGMQAAQAVQQSGMMDEVMNNLRQINFTLIIGCFIFFFFFFYLLYSSLFAVVGCAVNEDPQDVQSLMLPVTLPIIFAIVIMIKAVNVPNSSLAIFGSLFPLTSPVVMMARIAHGIPDGVTVLQLILSMVFLIIGFLFTTWFAGKIYRTGILLYGKKATWKEMWKWAVRKN